MIARCHSGYSMMKNFQRDNVIQKATLAQEWTSRGWGSEEGLGFGVGAELSPLL